MCIGYALQQISEDLQGSLMLTYALLNTVYLQQVLTILM